MSSRGDVCVYMCVCVRVRMCSINGLSILFRIDAKPIKCALVTYTTFCLNFYHVGLFFFIFMCM